MPGIAPSGLGHFMGCVFPVYHAGKGVYSSSMDFEHLSKMPLVAALTEIISEGGRISKSTEFGVHSGTDRDFDLGVPARHYSWKIGTQNYLLDQGFDVEAERFGDLNGVPLMVSGPEYGISSSPESLALMEKIRLSLQSDLEILRSLRARQLGIHDGKGIPVCISARKGIYRPDDLKSDEKGHRYEVRGNRLDFLFQLVAGEQPHGVAQTERGEEELTKSRISRDIDDLNKIFQATFGFTKPLVVHSDTSGYSLNRDVYAIATEDLPTELISD